MYRMLITGAGGQGILFMGKQLALAAMSADLNVTTLPSYGAEMRGGTSSCNVIIDNDFIGSPAAVTPNILVAMNKPSFERFISRTAANGKVFANSSLVSGVEVRSDVTAFFIPATELAQANGLSHLDNVIMLGKLIKETGMFEYGYFEKCLTDFSKSRPGMAEKNAAALKIGFGYEG